MTISKCRFSNIELLRIVSIFLVLVLHSCFLSTGVPHYNNCIEKPISSFLIFFFNSLSCVCVNVFVIISGWFGIHLSKKKVISFIFQVLFFSFTIYFVFLLYDTNKYFSKEAVITIFFLKGSEYWFVKAYIGLMILSPLLNLFIKNATNKELKSFLILFYAFQTIYAWLSLYGADWFSGGYSATSFIGLYVFIGYLRKSGLKEFENILSCRYNLVLSAKSYFIIYFTIILSLTFMAYIVTILDIPVAGRLFTYTQPFVIIASVCLFICFSKLTLKNKIINNVAISCFAVYLLHGHELILRPIFGKIIRDNFNTYNTLEFSIFIISYLVFWFIFAIILDKLRLFIWNKIVYFFNLKLC